MQKGLPQTLSDPRRGANVPTDFPRVQGHQLGGFPRGVIVAQEQDVGSHVGPVLRQLLGTVDVTRTAGTWRRPPVSKGVQFDFGGFSPLQSYRVCKACLTMMLLTLSGAKVHKAKQCT